MRQTTFLGRALLVASLPMALTGCGGGDADGSCTIVNGDGGAPIVRCSDGTEAPIALDTSCTVSQDTASSSVDCDDGSGTTVPRLIQLPVEHVDVSSGDALYVLNGGADISGLRFGEAGFPRLATGFALPPDYQPGGDISVHITWANAQAAVDCNFLLESNGVSAFRPNVAPIYTYGYFDVASLADSIVLTAASTGRQVRQVTMTIVGTNSLGDDLYQPGDNIVIRLNRDPDEAADTCTGNLYLLGMYATY